MLWDDEAAASYDTPGEGMFAPSVVEPAVERLAGLAGDGAALEFAVGTGRIGLPLAARGVTVAGIEMSEPMAGRLREKDPAFRVVIGDMATTRVDGEFSLVYLVFNTISNLLSQAEQVECFRNAARHLRPGGRFVVELFVPDLRRVPVERDGYLLVHTYDVLNQGLVSSHFWFDGTRAKTFRSPHRYVWPAELDLMGQLAGFELEARHADWSGGAFTADSTSHVSTYRLRG